MIPLELLFIFSGAGTASVASTTSSSAARCRGIDTNQQIDASNAGTASATPHIVVNDRAARALEASGNRRVDAIVPPGGNGPSEPRNGKRAFATNGARCRAASCDPMLAPA